MFMGALSATYFEKKEEDKEKHLENVHSRLICEI